MKGSGGSLTQLERLKNTTTSDIYLGTLWETLKNITKKGIISLPTIVGAKENYKERCTLDTLLVRLKNTTKNAVLLVHYW